MDNIPEFYETEYDLYKSQYDRMLKKEHMRHGKAMFEAGIVEGMRQAIHVIKTRKEDVEPSGKWPGMNAAISAIESRIEQIDTNKDEFERSLGPEPRE